MAEKTEKSTEKSKFSDREMEVLAAAWLCAKSEIQIDYDKLAQLTGYKSTKACSNAWLAIRKKIATHSPENAAFFQPKPSTSSAPSTPKKRKTPAKKVPADDGEDGGEVKTEADGAESPTKKKRGGGGGGGRKKKVVSQEEVADEFETEAAGELFSNGTGKQNGHVKMEDEDDATMKEEDETA